MEYDVCGMIDQLMIIVLTAQTANLGLESNEQWTRENKKSNSVITLSLTLDPVNQLSVNIFILQTVF